MTPPMVYEWKPSQWTRPLSEDFITDGPKLRWLVEQVWSDPTVPGEFHLDRWQEDLIDRMLERYPDDHENPDLAGRLRYRQIVVSIPRQNGKSVLGAIFALYGLMLHSAGPYVVGVAKSAEQARIIYDRLLYAIDNSALLKREFKKLTETRGIRTADGRGRYEIKASRGDSLQGIPVSLGIFDELHIAKPEIWQSLINGQATRADGLLVGITTAGDEQSTLLQQLYTLGQKAADGDATLERFGFFVWEAPESRIPDTDEELIQFLLEANPALREGRIPLSPIVADVRATPPADVIRYRFNRFVSSANAFISAESWRKCAVEEPFPAGIAPIFIIDRTPDWGYASISVAARMPDGSTYLDLAASILRPTLSGLADLCVQLSAHGPSAYVVDSYQLPDLGEELKHRGLPVTFARQADVANGSALFSSKVLQRKIKHPGHHLLSLQVPRTVRKNVGDGFRISRKDSSIEIDAVIGHTIGTQVAETQRDTPLQVF